MKLGLGLGFSSYVPGNSVPSSGQLFEYTVAADSAKITSGPHTGFVALINDGVFMRDAPSIWNAPGSGGAKDDGADIRVFDGSGNALPFDLRSFDKSTRRLQLWVRFATLSGAASTLKVRWGDTTLSALAVTDPAGRNAVYQDYEAALALREVGDYADLTGKGHDGTATINVSLTASNSNNPFGDSWLDAQNAYITLANSISLLDGSPQGTLQGWVNNESASSSNNVVNTTGSGGFLSNRQNAITTNFAELRFTNGTNYQPYFQVHDGTAQRIPTTGVVQRGLTQQLHGVWDATDAVLFADGVASTPVTTAWGDSQIVGTEPFRIFLYNAAANWFDGRGAEVRLRKTRLSAGHIATEAANQRFSNMLSFWSAGSVTALGATSVPSLTAARNPSAVTTGWPTTTVCSFPAVEATNAHIHPKVLDTVALGYPGGWNGKRYWAATTNYPSGGSGDLVENPSVFCSDDGTTFATPSGGSNPVVPAPSGVTTTLYYNSDPHLVLIAGTMYLFWRVADFRASSLFGETIFYKTSTDGINWSAAVNTGLRTHTVGTLKRGMLLSPALIYKNGVWHCWVVDIDNSTLPQVDYYRASSVTGPWWGPVRVPLPAWPGGSNEGAWHLDVIEIGDGFAMLMHTYTETATRSGNLYLGYSDARGTVFNFDTSKKLANGTPFKAYRSTLVRKSDDSGWDIWATNMDSRRVERFSVTDP